MAKYSQGVFTPKNVNKYLGTKQPRFRSGWELAFMRMCDAHPNITGWASEAIKIPYIHPMTGRSTRYVPDFIIQYADKRGKNHTEVIEIKPYAQTTEDRATHVGEKAQAQINKAKWTAAVDWCSKKGMVFRVLTENEIFTNPTTRKPRKRR